ncbi:MAG TPA: hypothetical protein VFT24_10230 [Vicinamibacterales bacterium]|nr:hypothetical protein [Vicinamibacterales bacterium]
MEHTKPAQEVEDDSDDEEQLAQSGVRSLQQYSIGGFGCGPGGERHGKHRGVLEGNRYAGANTRRAGIASDRPG